MREFMSEEGTKVVSGGIERKYYGARFAEKHCHIGELSRFISAADCCDLKVWILVTEGVLTLGKALKLLKKYERDDFDVEFFDELDADNGASRLARLLIEECTDIHLFVGTATNEAHQNSNLPFDLSIRMNLVEQLQEVARKMGKQVCVKYY